MVLTLAPFSGVNVTSKIALWEMRSQTQDSPAPMRAAKRLETSRIASSEEVSPSGTEAASPSRSEAASPSSSCSLPSLSPPSSCLPPPSPKIGEICYARICYYVAETQDLAPSVELAGIPPSVELAGALPSVELPTVSLVSKPKTSSDCTSSLLELPFESAMSRLPFESPTSPLPFEPSTFSLPFEGMTCSPSVEDATSLSSPSSATFSVSTEASEPLDALDIEGVEPILDFPVATPSSGLLWRRQ